MLEVSAGFITGLMFGLEFPDLEEDMSFAMVVDLGIFRIMLINWKEAE